MHRLLITIFISLFIMIVEVHSQVPESFVNGFTPPLKGKIYLSGNFAEPRGGHFHAGCDIKTGGVIGKSLHAVEKGYVARVNISPWGYGKAIYIMHADSVMTVYGHIDHFAPKLQKEICKMQYEQQAFRLDTSLAPGIIPVEKDEVFAYSGNSGSSGGPHLHFEIRTQPGDSLYNPQDLLNVTDTRAPEFKSLVVFNLSETPGNNAQRSVSKRLRYISGTDYQTGLISLPFDSLGIAVEVIDRMNYTHNRYGLEHIRLFLNDSLVYHSHIDHLSYNYQSEKEGLFDYYYEKKYRDHVQKCFREPGWDLPLIETDSSGGLLMPMQNDTLRIRVEAEDFAGNLSVLSSEIMYDKQKMSEPSADCKYLKPGVPGMLIAEGFRMDVPGDALYRTECLTLRAEADDSGLSPRFRISDPYIALKNPVEISIYGADIPDSLTGKTFIACRQNRSKRFIPARREGLYFVAHTTRIGDYFLDMDTVKPEISFLNMYPNKAMQNFKSIRLKVSDDMAGLADYDAWIDGEWVLLQYEPKAARMEYVFDDHMPEGESHTFKIRVSDRCGNLHTREMKFRY